MIVAWARTVLTPGIRPYVLDGRPAGLPSRRGNLVLPRLWIRMRGALVYRPANHELRRNVEAPAFAFTDVLIQRILKLAEQL